MCMDVCVQVNCPFYFKIGACRHADRCSRLHHRPAFSPTILMKHIFVHPVKEAETLALAEGKDRTEVCVDKERANEDFLQFFENMYEELGKFGRLEALHVCDNLGDHMVGHVYAKFRDEEEASDALNVMNGRFYDGRQMQVEFSPVTDFREARCRDFDEDTCIRGGFCNFMHIKPVPICLIRSLEEDAEEERRRENAKLLEKKQRNKRRRYDNGSSSSSRRSRDKTSKRNTRTTNNDKDTESIEQDDDSSSSRSNNNNNSNSNNNNSGSSSSNKRHRSSRRRSSPSSSRSRSRSRSREGRKEDKN